MSREMLIEQLSLLPARIKVAEHSLFEAQVNLTRCRGRLQEKEDRLRLQFDGGLINGKNAEIREAQLRVATAEERSAVQVSEAAVNAARIDLEYERNELAAARALARLLAGGSE